MADNNDSAALERVRNRLVSTPDAKLPSVLQKLLPRLVSRFPTTPTTTTAAARVPPNHAGSVLEVADDDGGVDPHLAGIFDHILERILLNETLVTGGSTEWIASLLDASVPATTTTTTPSPVHHDTGWIRYKYVLPILEVALTRCNNDCVTGALSKLMLILEDIQSQALLVLFGVSNTTSTHAGSLEKVRDQASWMVVEQIAKHSNVQPILDWNYLADDWDDLNAPANYKKIDDYLPTPEEQHAASSLDSVYSLFLDFFTFDPKDRTMASPTSTTTRWTFRRQTERIQEDYNQVSSQQAAERRLMNADPELRSTALLVNATNPGRRNRDPTTWFEAELRYWRALQKCLQPYAVLLFSNNNIQQQQQQQQQQQIPTTLYHSDREDMLRILTGQRRPVTKDLSHYNRPKASKMYKVNGRKRAQLALEKEQKQVCRHSLAVSNALLELIIGRKQAVTISASNNISSSSSNNNTRESNSHCDLLGSNLFRTSRRPLPNTMAQKVFAYLLTADLDLDLASESDSTVVSSELELFVESISQLKTVPSIHAPISNETYELIGAQTPAPMCWAVHFLWKVSSQVLASRKLIDSGSSSNLSNDSQQSAPLDQLYSTLSKRAWDAAVELLDCLQDISVQRFQRDRRLATTRDSQYRRIHESREKQALKSPFVLEALKARSEAYQLVTKFVTSEKLLASSASGPEYNSSDLSWDLAVRILNCNAFDLNKEILPALQEVSISVLSVYRDATEREMDHLSLPKINPLLLPLLKACVSSSDWSREFALQWAEDILINVDPELSRIIFECLKGDEVPHVARRAQDALQRLSIQITHSKNDNRLGLSGETAIISFWNPTQTVDKDAISRDMANRIEKLAAKNDGLSPISSRLVLLEFGFSISTAQVALEEDFGGTLSRCGCPQPNYGRDAMEVSGGVSCEVCFEDIPGGEGFALSCNHRFCVQCWQEGIAATSSHRELVSFSCLQHDCSLRVTQEDVSKLAPAMTPAIEAATLECFLLASSDYTFCPGADCPSVAQCNSALSKNERQREVTCGMCSTSFCFGCSGEPHSPVSCEVRNKYRSTVDRIEKHEDSVENKTIACPTCGIGITKNGGCMHMTCSQCRAEFCWICLSLNWQDHVCNVFDSLTGVDDVQRLRFFSHRVNAHLQAGQAAQNLLDNFHEHAHDIQYHARYCDETHLDILKSAWMTLVRGRKYLANSYISAYGISAEIDNAVQREFQTHQSQLQLFLEQLSLLCDNVPNLYNAANNEKDFRVRLKGIRFCAVAVTAYGHRVDDFMKRHFDE